MRGITATMLRFILLLLFFASFGEGFWRMPCTNFPGLYRIDPLVYPGVPSEHAHSYHGGSNFGFDTTYEDLMASPCTSCDVAQDKSAYWIPGLYFKFPNGTVIAVRQVGGLVAYYDMYPATGPRNIVAFPAGFKMLAGDTYERDFKWQVPEPEKSLWTGAEATEAALRQKALGFNCLHYGPTSNEATTVRHFLPPRSLLDTCKDGLRLEIVFPSCWNGKDLDSPDHKSHVAYSSLVLDGTCPEGFPIRLPTLLYESIWAIEEFTGVEGKFLLSNGDETGLGLHGDFISGWKPEFLQSAIDHPLCGDPRNSGEIKDCPLFTIQDGDKCQKFTPPSQIMAENCMGPMGSLCGGKSLEKGGNVATSHVQVTVTVTSTYHDCAAAPTSRHVHHKMHDF